MIETSLTPRNAAILRCRMAERRSRRESKSKGRNIIEATICADEAYRKALPELVGYENIRDFIACVTYGMANDTITALRGTKLLAGARLALRALRDQPALCAKNEKAQAEATADWQKEPLEEPQSLTYHQLNL